VTPIVLDASDFDLDFQAIVTGVDPVVAPGMETPTYTCANSGKDA